MAPGPSVAEHTPALPVSRPYTSAMNEAPCSCLVSTYSMDDFDTASVKRMFSSPGMPKTWVTPSFSRHSTINSAVVRLGSPILTSLAAQLRPQHGFGCHRFLGGSHHGLDSRTLMTSRNGTG